MRFSVLSSGSKANSTFIEAGSTRILVDCGLSCRTLEARLQSIDIDPATLSGILVTHEHSDHIRGISRLSKRHKIPVYCNRGAKRYIGDVHGFDIFETGKYFSVGELEVNPVSIVHDAQDPVGFILRHQGIALAQITDLGKVTSLVKEAMIGCHSIVLESNHDKDLLWSCDYPWDLKQRISSQHGHLSNEVAAELLSELFHADLHHVVLGHISENSNRPEIALESARKVLGDRAPRSLRAANVYTPTPLLAVAA